MTELIIYIATYRYKEVLLEQDETVINDSASIKDDLFYDAIHLK